MKYLVGECDAVNKIDQYDKGWFYLTVTQTTYLYIRIQQ